MSPLNPRSLPVTQRGDRLTDCSVRFQEKDARRQERQHRRARRVHTRPSVEPTSRTLISEREHHNEKQLPRPRSQSQFLRLPPPIAPLLTCPQNVDSCPEYSGYCCVVVPEGTHTPLHPRPHPSQLDSRLWTRPSYASNERNDQPLRICELSMEAPPSIYPTLS
jgi:hypothetical protein